MKIKKYTRHPLNEKWTCAIDKDGKVHYAKFMWINWTETNKITRNKARFNMKTTKSYKIMPKIITRVSAKFNMPKNIRVGMLEILFIFC